MIPTHTSSGSRQAMLSKASSSGSPETGSLEQANPGSGSFFATGPQHQLHQSNPTTAEHSPDAIPTLADPWMPAGSTTGTRQSLNGIGAQTGHNDDSYSRTSAACAAVSPNEPASSVTTNTRPMIDANASSHFNLAATTIIKQPSTFDVVLEDNLGNPAVSSLAEANAAWHNGTFAEMLASYAESFSLAPLSTQAVIVQAISSRIHQINGRFLERHGKGWKEISDKNSVFLGIARALFHQMQLINASTSPSVSVPQEATTTTTDATTTSSVSTSNDNQSLSDPTSTVLQNPDQTSVLQLYLEPMRSSDTMGQETFASVGRGSGSSPVIASRIANVSLPLMAACNAELTNYSHTVGKSKVAKRSKVVKKSALVSVVVKKQASSHNADGTFAHKRGGSPSGTSQRKRGTLSPEFKNKNVLTAAETISGFDPQTWFAEFGTLQSMNERAPQLVECISVDAIPRGVTVRPSGKWQAQFYFDGQSRYIGVFDGSHQAALAYECVHRLLAGYRELSRLKKPFAEKVLSKEETRKLFDNARLASVRAVTNPSLPASFE